MVIRGFLFATCAASVLGLSAGFAHAAAASASASDASSSGTTVGELVVTAEKREQNLQTVPVAISAYTAARRQLIGIDSIQDMTNFTPGLEYNSSTDRISLRGVGRQTNVLSADASVANYSDGIYQTFAVGAGASTLFLDRVEILRGPQGTLYGRNAIGGAINEISRHPTTTPYAEIRGTYSNYNHYNIEAAISGPITDNIQGRLAGNFEQQTQGWIKNLYPGQPDEGNIIKQFFIEGQLQGKFGDKFDWWAKVGFNQWANGAGGPGAASAGWTPFPYDTSEYSNAATQLNPGYACQPSAPVSNVVNKSPYGCSNPAQQSPWLESRAVTYQVNLPYSYNIAAHLTYHLPFADIKYVTGGFTYKYELTGPSGGTNGPGYLAPVSSYTINGTYGPLVINPQESFYYLEENASWSHELNLISTTPGPLQWVVGLYYYRQHYNQPVYTQDFAQPQWNGPYGAPGFFCSAPEANGGNGIGTNGVCADQTDFRRFDNRPSVTNVSYASFAQVDYKLNDQFKFTGGIRYSHDNKEGSESVRLLCFAVAPCYGDPNVLGPYTLATDLTQLGTVVATGLAPNPNGGPNVVSLPQGVTTVTSYSPTNGNSPDGFATRYYDASWSAVTGTAGVEWTPNSDTLVYAKYSRGYKSGGYNIGIFTVLSFEPYTAPESVNSYEIGYKQTWFRQLTTDLAVFYYGYNNLQIPVTITQNAGGEAQNETAFYNVPTAVSEGVELETTWQATKNLAFLLDYSYLNAYATSGALPDPADPDALQPGATPLPCTAATPCTPDIYTGGMQRYQSLNGNKLPNAPANKVAFNASYTWFFTAGALNMNGSFIWRDTQEGALFTRYYNTAPSWDEFDARITYTAASGRYKVIFFGKNLFNTIGYDAGAYGTRYAGVNSVNGVLVPEIQAPGIGSTYSVTPPRTYGIEIDYKFF